MQAIIGLLIVVFVIWLGMLIVGRLETVEDMRREAEGMHMDRLVMMDIADQIDGAEYRASLQREMELHQEAMYRQACRSEAARIQQQIELHREAEELGFYLPEVIDIEWNDPDYPMRFDDGAHTWGGPVKKYYR